MQRRWSETAGGPSRLSFWPNTQTSKRMQRKSSIVFVDRIYRYLFSCIRDAVGVANILHRTLGTALFRLRAALQQLLALRYRLVVNAVCSFAHWHLAPWKQPQTAL